jgi:hypothetical protein
MRFGFKCIEALSVRDDAYSAVLASQSCCQQTERDYDFNACRCKAGKLGRTVPSQEDYGIKCEHLSKGGAGDEGAVSSATT